MNFAWTPHRFSGGALALDLANSVIMRHEAARRVDRLADDAAFLAFGTAAARHCAERDLAASLSESCLDERDMLVSLREAIDACLRRRVATRYDDDMLLADLLEQAASCLRRSKRACSGLGAAAARSALRLAVGRDDDRLKVCGNCGWLFLDRSRNGSRVWCDMSVCGNRQKARRHYQRKTAGLAP